MLNTPDSVKCFVPGSVPVSPTAHGNLDGIRIALKDVFAVEEHISSFGHLRWRDTHGPAKENAIAVDRLLGSGAEVVGLTKLDQLAYSLIGNVGEGDWPLNTFDRNSYCGGSSSGSASAVAAGLADLGIGTDTAGSIRVPAAACGLFAIRTTHGLIDLAGVIPLADSFDVVGILAQQVSLLMRTVEVLASSVPAPKRFHRVLVPEGIADQVQPATVAAMAATASRISGACDLEIGQVDVSSLISSQVGDLFTRIQGREIWENHGEWVSDNLEYLAPDVQERLRRAAKFHKDPDSVKEADALAKASYVNSLNEVVGDQDVLLLPVVPREGPKLAWNDEELLNFRVQCFRLTGPSSLTSAPQVVFPTGVLGLGRFSLGLLGRKGSDLSLLSLVAELCGESDEATARGNGRT